ncbi:MAG: DUF721 domain-containing protein [Chitinophagales bacterium]
MNDNFKTLGDALSEFSGQKKLKNSVAEVRLVTFWKELMGDLVDKYTESLYLKNNVLFVKVGPDALKNELLYSKETIIEKINLKFGSNLVQKLVIQ